jgi:hypothetical protein
MAGPAARLQVALQARSRPSRAQTASQDEADPQPDEQRRDGVAADEPREVSWQGLHLCVPKTRRVRKPPCLEHLDSRCPSFIVMMEIAHLRNCHHGSEPRWLDRASLGCVHGQRTVGAPAMIIRKVAGQQAHEMTFMEDDHMIQAFAPDAANETLDVWILPRRPWSRDHVLNPHMPHMLLKNRALDAVPIVQEISRLLIPWKGIDDLLCRPLGRGMRCHLEAHDAPSLMGQDQQHEQHLVGHRRHDKEI